nr:BrnA antitoxin family protein [Cohaesibacter celericrescens]
MIDEDVAPLTDPEIQNLRTGKELFAELGITPTRPIKRGRPVSDTPKKPVTLRLDADIVEYFREGGKGWQTRINDALAKIVEEDKKAS